MLNPNQFLIHIIRPSLYMLKDAGGEGWDGAAAEELVLGTALVESNLTYLVQHGGGPALSVFQLEPKTIADIQDNFIRHRHFLREAIAHVSSTWPILPDQVKGNLYLATMFCRIHYRRAAAPLPVTGDVDAQAKYWKTYYNTAKGKGNVSKYKEAWKSQRTRN